MVVKIKKVSIVSALENAILKALADLSIAEPKKSVRKEIARSTKKIASEVKKRLKAEQKKLQKIAILEKKNIKKVNQKVARQKA